VLANMSVPGEVTLSFNSIAALSAGPPSWSRLPPKCERQPSTAGRSARHHGVRVNEGRLPATADDAIHTVAYFGDTTATATTAAWTRSGSRGWWWNWIPVRGIPCIDPVVIATSMGLAT